MSKKFNGIANLKKRDYFNKNSNAKKYIYHEALELTDIVPANGNDGYLEGVGYLSTVNQEGEKIQVKIRQSDYERNMAKKRSNEEVKFFGFKIDNLMKNELIKNKHVPKHEKNIVLLENAERKAVVNQDGEKIKVYECSYVHNVTDSSKEKFTRAILTASGSFNQEEGRYYVNRIQKWNKQTISIDDKAGIKELKEKIEAVKTSFENKDNKHQPVGFKFVIVTENDKYDETQKYSAKYKAIFTSESYLYNHEEEKVMDGDFFVKEMEAFKEFAKEEFEGKFENIKLLVVHFENYRTSKFYSGFRFTDTQTGSPFWQMVTTRTGYSVLDDEFVEIRHNWGGEGFMELSKDKIKNYKDEDGNIVTEVTPTNFVKRVLMTGYRGNVLEFLTVKEGDEEFRICVDPALYRVTDDNRKSKTENDSDYEEMYHGTEDEEDTNGTPDIKADEVEAENVNLDFIDDDIPF